jgi:RimJ/RimL family protein N-acetyltransferase
MLESGYCELTATSSGGEDFVVRSTRVPLLAVVGRPDPSGILAAALAAGPDAGVVAAEETADHAAAALAGWRREGATIYTLPEEGWLTSPPDVRDAEIWFLDDVEARLAHVPGRLRRELLDASAWSPIAAVFIAGRGVSFCYASAETTSLWDVSIDTLEEFRGRGLAAHAVHHMAGYMALRRKRPVWGAEDSNAASRRLAEKLGFLPVDRLVVFRRP